MAAFSDNFNRSNADSLGGNWSEVVGDIDIVSNAAVPQTASGTDMAIWTANALAANQYAAILETDGAGGTAAHIILRYTDSSSVFYVVALDNSTGNLTWSYKEGTGDSLHSIESASLADWTDFNQLIGITIESTGNSTILRAWGNCSGLPSAVDNWNGDTSPSLTFTNNPGVAADTGTLVGIGAVNSNATVLLTDFYGGDFAGGPAASILRQMMQHN